VALAMVAGGLTAACSTYRPLDDGSRVPWAKGGEVPGLTAAADAGPAAVSLPADGYLVERGDQLGSLARNLGVSVQALAEANQLEPPYVIYVGQTLRIPEGAKAAEPADQQDSHEVQVVQLGDEQLADLAPAAGPEAATPAAIGGEDYVVSRGETLWSISQRVDVPLTELAATNEIPSPYEVLAGQRLRIPGPDSSAAEMVTPTKVAAHRHGTEPPPLTGRGFIWPVNGKVVGGFGRTREGQRRDGIDIAARAGAPVVAAEDGLVAYAGEGIHGYGRLILLRHGDGYITTYGHNAALLVEAGELVERGQVIARVGSTGNATRSMLHFELRKGRKPIDPETVLVHESTAVASTD
jgi:murein DD-endopeptidase MepM/ murein hydrolase activator NlpD